ncbi:Nuclear inhibitor of protein phosphatase 1 [Cichlidogyrus casuarinus]|uniref:Nuclear inhibitor of protein phosphatase 1 n=1 Tax=Cichlidogyrus casuarinus TaxID=1844966 RepID=A0ABD2Q6D0_9PLAT
MVFQFFVTDSYLIRAGKPHEGLHMDVMKDGKLVQKLMIDEKKFYYFGRNRQMCDFAVDHQSCSRCHAALVWHSYLKCPFLVDLGSVHGTYIGRVRLESKTPQKVPFGAEIHFGASTRVYVIREKPKIPGVNQELDYSQHSLIGPVMKPLNETDLNESFNAGNSSVLPEVEYELDNLTEFNTAHNRRITKMITLGIVETSRKSQKPKLNVHFNDHDEIINPEDVDPGVGRFRNMVEQSFVPNKRHAEERGSANMGISSAKRLAVQTVSRNSASENKLLLNPNHKSTIYNPSFNLAAKLGLPMPNLAPDLNENESVKLPSTLSALHAQSHLRHNLPVNAISDSFSNGDTSVEAFSKKKKYVKEAWPGKAPTLMPVGPRAN